MVQDRCEVQANKANTGIVLFIETNREITEADTVAVVANMLTTQYKRG